MRRPCPRWATEAQKNKYSYYIKIYLEFDVFLCPAINSKFCPGRIFCGPALENSLQNNNKNSVSTSIDLNLEI
jgi:hypothetical protein